MYLPIQSWLYWSRSELSAAFAPSVEMTDCGARKDRKCATSVSVGVVNECKRRRGGRAEGARRGKHTTRRESRNIAQARVRQSSRILPGSIGDILDVEITVGIVQNCAQRVDASLNVGDLDYILTRCRVVYWRRLKINTKGEFITRAISHISFAASLLPSPFAPFWFLSWFVIST